MPLPIPIDLNSSPISVVCHECHAAVGAQCTTKVRDGSKFIETFHKCRVELFLQQFRIETESYQLYLHLDQWTHKPMLCVEADGMYLNQEQAEVLAANIAHMHLAMSKHADLYQKVSPRIPA